MMDKIRMGVFAMAAIFLAGTSFGQEFTKLPFPKRSKPAKGEKSVALKLEMEHAVSLDLEKVGHPVRYKFYWDGEDGDDMEPRGHLHLRSPRTSGDDFDLGVFPYAEFAVLDLPSRSVLVVRQTGPGGPAGDEYHLFSSSSGILYRVQFLDEAKSAPAIFGEHNSAGSPAHLSFLAGGRKIKTIGIWPYDENKIHPQ